MRFEEKLKLVMNMKWSEIWTPIPISHSTADFLSLGCQLPAEVRILSLPLNVSLLEPISLEIQNLEEAQTCLIPRKMRAQESEFEGHQSWYSLSRDGASSGQSSCMFSNPMEKPFKRLKTEDDFTKTNLSSSGINWVLHQDSEFKDDWEIRYPPEDPEFKDDWGIRSPEDPTNYLTSSHQIESPLMEQGLRKQCFPIIAQSGIMLEAGS
jgi:hypothetical protein